MDSTCSQAVYPYMCFFLGAFVYVVAIISVVQSYFCFVGVPPIFARNVPKLLECLGVFFQALFVCYSCSLYVERNFFVRNEKEKLVSPLSIKMRVQIRSHAHYGWVISWFFIFLVLSYSLALLLGAKLTTSGTFFLFPMSLRRIFESSGLFPWGEVDSGSRLILSHCAI